MPAFVQGHTPPVAEGGGGAHDIVASRMPQLPSRLKRVNASASCPSEMRSKRHSKAVLSYTCAIRCIPIPSNPNAMF